MCNVDIRKGLNIYYVCERINLSDKKGQCRPTTHVLKIDPDGIDEAKDKSCYNEDSSVS